MASLTNESKTSATLTNGNHFVADRTWDETTTTWDETTRTWDGKYDGLTNQAKA